jgi:hypothetical protein
MSHLFIAPITLCNQLAMLLIHVRIHQTCLTATHSPSQVQAKPISPPSAEFLTGCGQESHPLVRLFSERPAALVRGVPLGRVSTLEGKRWATFADWVAARWSVIPPTVCVARRRRSAGTRI